MRRATSDRHHERERVVANPPTDTADARSRDPVRFEGVKYRADAFAEYYARKHERSLASRISNWRERGIMSKALRSLAPFNGVLDLPSGAGRFLSTLSEFEVPIIASDQSAEMLAVGRRWDAETGSSPRRLVTSALCVGLGGDSVDVAFCARLLHHFQDRETRVGILREMARVARKGVVVSFFDSAAYKQWRRQRRDRIRGRRGNRHAFSRAEMVAEAAEAGLEPVAMHALMRYYAEVTAAAFRVVPRTG